MPARKKLETKGAKTVSDANVMAAKPVYAQVTADSLRYGAQNVLGLQVPRNAKAHQIKQMITDLLRQDATFAHFSCAACFEPLVLGVTMCPYCTASFGMLPPEVQTLLEEFRRSQDRQMVPPDGRDYLDLEEEDVDDDFSAYRKPPSKIPEAQRGAGEKNTKKDDDKPRRSKTAEQIRTQLGDDDKGRRYQQIQSELPYTRTQLEMMRRIVLVMIMSALGQDDPVHAADTTEEYIERILRLQTETYGTDENGEFPEE